MGSVKGFDKLDRRLQKMSRRVSVKKVTVKVSYTASYAIYVHENLEAFHPVGQAKYLEQPFREMLNNGTFKEMMNKSLRQGMSLTQAMTLIGLRLQRESQQRVPVDTGNLRNSARTEVMEGR
jgi:predicted secreted hydrolase